MEMLTIEVLGLELKIPSTIYEADFNESFSKTFVPKVGGNKGFGLMGKMGWDLTYRDHLRRALITMGVEILKDPPELLPGFEFDESGKVVRINRKQFPF